LPVKGLEASMSYIIEKLSPLLEVIVVLIPILIGVAYVTIAERKGMGSMQRRVGPNAVGI
jgi:NADH:ubiquinone oxidoreductase subunit H